MAPETADRVAAKLDWLRTILPAVAASPESFDMEEVAGDFGRLLAATEAVAALHQPGRFVVLGAVCKEHEAYPNFSITSTEAQHLKDCPDCPATVSVSCTCGYPDLDRCPHRAAITDELLGKENGHD
jgi:hypothetical protein